MKETFLVDTHLHLNDQAFAEDVDAVINRALASGVKRFLVCGDNYASSVLAVALASQYPEVYAAVGLHPSEVKETYDISWLESLAQSPKVLAIGEIGLDFYWDKTYADNQQAALREQMAIAEKLNLPVVIHSREAIEATYTLLAEFPAVKGIMHCYSGSAEMAERFIALGYYLGIGGVVTYKTARRMVEVVEKVPLAALLSETDSPYLPPDGYRGERNEPSYIRLVVAKIAELKGLGFAETAAELNNNAQKILNWEAL